MPKAFTPLTVIFGFAGLLMVVCGFYMLHRDADFFEDPVETSGVVSDLEYRDAPGNSAAYYPLVQYTDENGRSYEVLGQVGGRPPSYRRGETVEIIYERDNPEIALINDFKNLYGAPIGIIITGSIFASAGIGGALFNLRKQKRAMHLQENGLKIEASFIECFRDMGLEVGGRNPWRVAVQARNPLTDRQEDFVSEAIWVDLGEELSGARVPVFLDRDDTEKYWVDLSGFISRKDWV